MDKSKHETSLKHQGQERVPAQGRGISDVATLRPEIMASAKSPLPARRERARKSGVSAIAQTGKLPPSCSGQEGMEPRHDIFAFLRRHEHVDFAYGAFERNVINDKTVERIGRHLVGTQA